MSPWCVTHSSFTILFGFTLTCTLIWPCELAHQEWALRIPRVTVTELAKNSTLRSGHHAYVLTGLFSSQWRSVNWTLGYLENKIPFEWVDYYPDNMADLGNKPYLIKFKEAVAKFRQPSSSPRYLQLRLSLRGWRRLRKDFTPKPLPQVFWDDDEWIDKCMARTDGKPDLPAIDNFFVTNQWKFLLIGERGTTMFFHKDGTAASSWQLQILGQKKWTLCPNTESRFLDVAINTFAPDYKAHPHFGNALCGQVTVAPGELLYYPAYWWHHTYQLETPSIAYTGALVGVEADRSDLGDSQKPHEQFYRDLLGKCGKCWEMGVDERKCDDISIQWPGAAPPPLRIVCDTYLAACYNFWDDHAGSLHDDRKQEL